MSVHLTFAGRSLMFYLTRQYYLKLLCYYDNSYSFFSLRFSFSQNKTKQSHLGDLSVGFSFFFGFLSFFSLPGPSKGSCI